MNKEELIITNEDIELLKEMKNNCLKTDVYNDEKRLLKANAITKFLMLQQENSQLKQSIKNTYESSQEMLGELSKENQQLHNKIEKIRELVENSDWRLDDVHDLIDGYNEIEEILKDSDVDE